MSDIEDDDDTSPHSNLSYHISGFESEATPPPPPPRCEREPHRDRLSQHFGCSQLNVHRQHQLNYIVHRRSLLPTVPPRPSHPLPTTAKIPTLADLWPIFAYPSIPMLLTSTPASLSSSTTTLVQQRDKRAASHLILLTFQRGLFRSHPRPQRLPHGRTTCIQLNPRCPP